MLRSGGRSRLVERLRQRHQARDARRIVDRAIADVVASHGRAAAKVVPMPGIENIFVGALGARQHADDVARHLLGNFVVETEVRFHPGQRDGFEALLLRRIAQRVEILSGVREQFLRLGQLDPAVGHGLARAAVLALGQILGPRVARFDDIPAIGGGFGVVDDQHRRGALPRRFFIFIRPAAIIGHCTAVEFALGFGGLPVGIVDEDDDGLPLHIKARIVVPALFGGDDAVSDKDHIAVLDRGRRLNAIAERHIVLGILRGNGRLAAGESQRRGVLRSDLDQRHILRPAAVVAGLQPRFLILLDQISDGLFLARGAGGTAFIGVERQLLRDFLQRRERQFGDFDVGDCGGGGCGGFVRRVARGNGQKRRDGCGRSGETEHDMSLESFVCGRSGLCQSIDTGASGRTCAPVQIAERTVK